MKLEEPVFRPQYFQLEGIDPFPKLIICGYKKSENKFYQMSQKANIKIPVRPLDGCVYYNIDIKPSQSGSPVFAIHRNSLRMVGIHISYFA